MKIWRFLAVGTAVVGGIIWTVKKLFSHFTFFDFMVLAFIVLSIYMLSVITIVMVNGAKTDGQ